MTGEKLNTEQVKHQLNKIILTLIGHDWAGINLGDDLLRLDFICLIIHVLDGK